MKTPSPTHILKLDPLSGTLQTQKWKILIAPPEQNPIAYLQEIPEITLGQDASNTLPIRDDFVSRQHCILLQDDDRLILQDLGSTNGTFFEGRRVTRMSLPTKGEFRIGKTTVTFERSVATEKILPYRWARFKHMIGESKAMREVFTLLEKVAPSTAPVLIMGESGTGKEMTAQLLHELSLSPSGPFVAVNCGAIPSTMIESLLFGHERGAFTGAAERHEGYFEQANGGTIFLDEIGELPMELQTRLLRILEEKKLRRIGGKHDIAINVRIVSATNRDVADNVKQGKFRSDLFYRLYVIPVILPPLRERREDVVILAEHFLKLANTTRPFRFTQKALEKMKAHRWPGNVRELKNTIERAVLLAHHHELTEDDLDFMPEVEQPACARNLGDAEKEIVLKAMRSARGNQSEAARELGIARTTLRKKLKKL
ncbi:MAG: sigma 54-interacting transcriptional regulator [Deltaproteobacteria bacterium]|nr:sigma 54-interacting transcriptional regulator [Deltaproteobacteria bacterium]